ncbi:MAG TPA: glycerophosphodiester phosphodiesterase family protein [Sediminibacterium sp.]|jgi:glycerophosphoryl diester phosphodiesterase|uniref:glycerophosphodiester phosphodiesterase family protein n=1 Tax=Sediminibacterium sp. TaxID=1917865 RepID=UPI0008B7729D|nr:glycerophosphodiester phosphodiesterase family protein [Sediminibacterium sp.]OHC85758.1 MAG: glycerophosphodiester phosphodiesterase [Sphingobacteriia bacterium RIFOXYC2_FULL_35_18]OHC87294.1 MAG: glycerophosphodiester phosphodiesterase [Sphingobacteriia bacterium RIFOXYD2_FULL_35_12]OYY10179.1 MAG: glycerophosphodiester phosphodiesterase [Sphingobacteriia bacterium 35-36-14]OYZ54955.1 MAG: glycerophosphodiester phosphodiesterase [Sphingobacteriia bacterium 24-36-13]OZA66096.1 MAG: glycero
MKNIFIISGMVFLYGCTSSKMNQQNNLTAFDWQGHRGARGLVPENTIPAMYKAIDLGAVTLEMDAVITADKQVLLSHEPFFNHEITTKPDGTIVTKEEEKQLNIYTMHYAATQRYDIGLRGNPRFPQQQKMAAYKPLLLDVIEAADQYALSKNKPLPFYNIETKSQPATDNKYHPSPKAFVDLLVAVIKHKKIEDRVTIQSFDIRTLQYLHQQYPSISTVLLIEDYNKKSLTEQLQELGFTPTAYSPHHSLVNEELVNACKLKGMKLVPWTVNDLATMKKLRALGVDGIISDYPNLFYFP